MFIGNHRGFSRIFRGFWPCGSNSYRDFNAKKAMKIRWFALGWFAAKFAVKTPKLHVEFHVASLGYISKTQWKLKVQSVTNVAVRCKIKPNKAQSHDEKKKCSLIGKYRYRKTWLRGFCHNVLPNIRRYWPNLSAHWPDGWSSASLGRPQTHLSSARLTVKPSSKPPFGEVFYEGFGEEFRELYGATCIGAICRPHHLTVKRTGRAHA